MSGVRLSIGLEVEKRYGNYSIKLQYRYFLYSSLLDQSMREIVKLI